MNIIVLGRNGHPSRPLAIGRWYHYVVAGLVSFALIAASMAGGYYIGARSGATHRVLAWQDAIQQSRREVRITRQTAHARIDALTLRLGRLQAEVMRIDALGGKLVKMAKLDPKEFNFSQPPGQGGPREPALKAGDGEARILSQIDALANQLGDREAQLKVLSQVLAHRHLLAETTPTGWPIDKGWISSYYGPRTDPFTGHRGFHPGIDFAGRKGQDVHAIAGGVVVFAGKDGGYGNMVEIDHGDGYATRYGHNRRIDVKAGEVVKRGQVIAQLGSTGRSTGPHVHLEVRYHGHSINPLKFIKQARN